MRRRGIDAESLWLVAATTAAVLAVQTLTKSKPERPHANGARRKPSADIADAAQPGRGRESTTPLEIPRAGWKDILWRTYQQINDDRLLAIAAGVVFYGLLAVFPAITALVSCYGMFADASTIADNLQTLAMVLPAGSFQIVQDQIARVLAKGPASLGFTFLFGIALALWSANAGVKAVIDALNVVYDEREKRSFIKLNALALSFTIGGIMALLVMVSAVVAFPLAMDSIGLAQDSKLLVSWARWPLLLIVVIAVLGLLYRFGPSRPGARWEWLGTGTIVAATLWLAGSLLLSWYLASFGNYDATYGSLGAAIGLMMWMWMSAIIVLCGAELNAEIEHQTATDTTVGPGRPMGARGASMADTLGRAIT